MEEATKKHILVVEDDPTNRGLIKQILEKKYKVDVANDAISALEKLSEQHYDLITIDINLPFGINGIELAKKIRAQEGFEATPLVAITAYVSDFTKELCLEKGFDYHIEKPFDVVKFEKLISDILG